MYAMYMYTRESGDIVYSLSTSIQWRWAYVKQSPLKLEKQKQHVLHLFLILFFGYDAIPLLSSILFGAGYAAIPLLSSILFGAGYAAIPSLSSVLFVAGYAAIPSLSSVLFGAGYAAIPPSLRFSLVLAMPLYPHSF